MKPELIPCADAKTGRTCTDIKKVRYKSICWCRNSTCRYRANKRLERQIKYLEEEKEWQEAEERRLAEFKEPETAGSK